MRWLLLALACVVAGASRAEGPIIPPPLPPAPPQVAVTLRGFSDSRERSRWCEWVLESLHAGGGVAALDGCAAQVADPDFTVTVERVTASGFMVSVMRRRSAPAEPSRLEWTVEQSAWDAQRAELFALVHDWLLLEATRGDLRQLLLRRGLDEALELGRASDGRYLDFTTGAPLDFPAALDVYLSREYRRPDLLGASLELVAELGAATAWYNVATFYQQMKWPYDIDFLQGLKKKLVTGEATYFDDNPLFLNAPGHPAAGACYVLSARAQGMSLGAAFGLAVASSSTWELVIEYREELSVNDMVFTPVGGLALGEPLHQLSQFFLEAEPTTLHRALSEVFGGPSSVNPFKLREPPGRMRLLDAHGWPSRAAADLHGYLGVDVARFAEQPRGQWAGSAGVSTELVLVPGYAAAGEEHAWLWGTYDTRFDARLSFGEGGITHLRLLGETAWAGLYAKSLSPALAGGNAWVGLSTLYAHEEVGAPGHWDQLAAVAAVGLNTRVQLRSGGLSVRSTVRAHPVMAAVRSLALDPDRGFALPEGERLPHELARTGYYWALGFRLDAGLDLAYRGTSAGLELEQVWAAAAGGFTGTAGALYMSDRRRTSALYVAQALPWDSLRLKAVVARARRSSVAGERTYVEGDVRVMAQLEWGRP